MIKKMSSPEHDSIIIMDQSIIMNQLWIIFL